MPRRRVGLRFMLSKVGQGEVSSELLLLLLEGRSSSALLLSRRLWRREEERPNSSASWPSLLLSLRRSRRL